MLLFEQNNRCVDLLQYANDIGEIPGNGNDSPKQVGHNAGHITGPQCVHCRERTEIRANSSPIYRIPGSAIS
jgi:hypothetical protein